MKIKRILLITALLCVANHNFKLNSQKNLNMTQDANIAVEVFKENELDLQLSAKSAYLIDFDNQQTIYEEEAEKRLPIASMCKIMTLLLSFEAIDDGIISMNEEICVSERAASMGGSQVFLEANAKYPVRELIKSIVVCSANDSCVAMAERIAGSEDIFINQMNEKAKEIGANNTLFSNCTGLPKEPQYSCAKDVALMLKALLKHEEYYQFGQVWMDKFQHPEGRYTEITNTNKLIRFYDGCDGGKTGFTNEAGFCLAATAKRNNLRVISVVIGEETSATRFEDVKTMFDYAFANYQNTLIVENGTVLEETIAIEGAKCDKAYIYPKRNVYVLSKHGEEVDIVTEIHLTKTKAPIKKNEEVGELLVFKNGLEIDRVPLLSIEKIEKANIFDWFKKIAEKWNDRKIN